MNSDRRSSIFLSSVTLALLLTGCSPSTSVREYVVEAETEKVFTSDVLRDEFGSVPLTWKAPESWTVAENDQFSKVAWSVGPAADRARITVTDSPAAAGLLPQLVRWRGQISMESDDKNPMAGTEQITLGTTKATWVDFEGPTESILGLIVSVRDKIWLFKFRGSNSITAAERKTFRDFCESVRVTGTEGE